MKQIYILWSCTEKIQMWSYKDKINTVMQHITKVAPLLSLSKKILSTPNMNLELFPESFQDVILHSVYVVCIPYF